MENKNNNTEVQATIKWGTVYGYGFFGQACRSAYLSFQAYYLLYFLTDGLGLNTYVAATIYTITQWIKVITMVGAGVLIDGVPLKGGKFRPWMKYMSIVLFFAFGLMWFNFGFNQVVSIIVFLVLFTLDMLSYNTIWVATRGLMGPMSKNSADSGRLAQGQQVSSSIIGIVNGMFYVAVVKYCTEHFNQGYSISGFLFAGIILVCMIPFLKITKPYDTISGTGSSQKAQKVSFLQMIKSMRGPMIPYFICHTLSSAREGFFYALLTYYTTYVLNNQMVMGYASTVQAIGGLIGALAMPWVKRKLGMKKATIFGLVFSGLLYSLIAFFGNTAVGYLSIRFVLSMITGATGAFGIVQANDIADWEEMHGEVPARGFIQSLAGTTVRAGGVLGSMISSFGFAALGYQTGTVPTEAVLNGMVRLLAFGPMIVSVIAGLSFIFYNVDEKALDEWKIAKYQKEQESKEAEAQAE